jgi:hypothetical protein
MKFFTSTGLVSVALFAALAMGCAGSDDNKNSLDPYSKPANPVPKEYIVELASMRERSKKYIPAEEAIFDRVIDEEEVKNVSESEKNEKMSLLNSSGEAFLKTIKTDCTIQNAKLKEKGSADVGQTQSKTLTMSAAGDKCPIEINRKEENVIQYQSTYKPDENGRGTVKGNGTKTIFSSFKILDKKIASLAGYKSLLVDYQLIGSFNVRIDPEETKLDSNGSLSGKVEIDLADGSKISGPLSGEVTASDEKYSVIVIFNGSTPKGDLKIAFVVDKDENSGLWINGEKADKDYLESFGGGFHSLQNALKAAQ